MLLLLVGVKSPLTFKPAGFSAFYFGQDAVYGLTDGNGQLTLAGQGFVLGQ